MNDMSQAIVPKSTQLNADDLIAGPMTVRITDVSIKPGSEQPVAVSFSGDNGKPFFPCKSMCRCLVFAWGPDASKYIGRSVTLYREASVKWAGMEVGGIRISHMSDIENPITMALTATKGSRKPYTVKVLHTLIAPSVAEYEACATYAAFDALESRRSATWKAVPTEQKKLIKAASDAAKQHLSKPAEFDAAAGLQRINEAGDPESAKIAFDAVVDHFDRLNEEVAPDFDAAYKSTLESLAK